MRHVTSAGPMPVPIPRIALSKPKPSAAPSNASARNARASQAAPPASASGPLAKTARRRSRRPRRCRRASASSRLIRRRSGARSVPSRAGGIGRVHRASIPNVRDRRRFVDESARRLASGYSVVRAFRSLPQFAAARCSQSNSRIVTTIECFRPLRAQTAADRSQSRRRAQASNRRAPCRRLRRTGRCASARRDRRSASRLRLRTRGRSPALRRRSGR